MGAGVVGDKSRNWLDVFLRGASSPTPPALNSERIKDLAGRGILAPGTLSDAEIQELSAAIISHLVATRG